MAFLVAAGCGQEQAPPPPRVDLPMDDSGAVEAIQLDRLTPTKLTLPESSLPEGNPFPDRFDVAVEKNRQGVYKGALPFPTSRAARRFAPQGMRVRHGDVELPYRTGKLRGGRHGWAISDDDLLVRLPGKSEAAAVDVEVVYPQLRERVNTMEFGASGLAAEIFVRRSLSIEGITRTGMMLPAPATAAYELDLPAGARLSTHVAMMPSPVKDGRSDGATLVVAVRAGGERHEVASVKVSGKGDEFDALDVDLSKWGGQRAVVELSTQPKGTPDYDYVFLGAPAISGDPQGPVRQVIVIGFDTTRPDHFGTHGYHRNTTPELDATAAKSAVFDAAWAPAPRTRPSFRTATTGRQPLDAVGATNIGAVFREHGFATAGIVANVHLHPRFDFDDGFDLWWQDTSAKADDQVDRALAWLEEHKDRDSYLFLHIMDPHLFYVAPRGYHDRFVEEPDRSLPGTFGRGDVYKWMRTKELSDVRKVHIEALYDGELAWTSHELGRFIDAIDRMETRNLIVFHSDHGEEFWEHGAFEHNHSLYDELTQALLWVRPPTDTPRRVQTPVMLADIAPTVFDYVGFTRLPTLDGRSLRPLIEGAETGDEAGWRRPIPVGYLRYGHERWGVVWQGHKYILHTKNGKEELYDLAADPGEHRDVAKKTPLEPWRQALALAHDVDVGPGWRVKLKKSGDGPLTVTLPAPALSATVLDPEAITANPVNQAWGEVPPVRPEDVATLSLDETKTALTIRPGSKGQGTLLLRFSEAVPPQATLTVGDDAAELPSRGTAALKGWTVQITAGTVVVPPPGEAARMRATAGDASAAELEMLQALGYVEED